MIMALGKRVLLCAAGFSMVLGVGAAAAQARPTAAQIADRVLADLREAGGVPGLGAAVWKDGAVVWTGSAGSADLAAGRPVTSDTIFRLASVSKLITVTAAARLREQGALDVDAPVQSLVPALNPKWPPLTARQLAAHTAGVPHYQAVDANRGEVHHASVGEALKVFKDRELLFAPGSAYNYSSYGYTLLSAEIEAAARRPFLDYVAAEITPGLAIQADATGRSPQASVAYEVEGDKVTPAAPHDFSYTWAGGGMGATAPALATFGGRLLDGRIVSRPTFDWMLVPAVLNDGKPVVERGEAIGFGWRTLKDEDGEAVARHAGVADGARSALVLYPQRRFAVGLLSNALWASSIEQSAMTMSAPFRGSETWGAARPCPTQMKAYAGTFDDKPISGTATFAVENGLCVGVMSVDGPFAKWMNDLPQKDATRLRLVGLDPRGGLARAALVTPAGAYELRPGQAVGAYAARLGPTRGVSLTFGP
jgi:CubicO group peptidase (beta-lactamase class C family)